MFYLSGFNNFIYDYFNAYYDILIKRPLFLDSTIYNKK